MFILLSSFPVLPADVQVNNEGSPDNSSSNIQNNTQNYTNLTPGEIELPSLPQLPQLPQLPVPRDLYVSAGDIQVTPNNPTEGDKIDITATIHDKNRFPTYNLVVKLYDNQTEIYTYTTKFLYNESFKITTSITTSRPGAHSIIVKIDPDNMISEKDKSNNVASVQINVKTKNVYKVSIDVDATNKNVTVGESTTYLVKIKNLGNVDDDISLRYELLAFTNNTNTTTSWAVAFSSNKVSISSGKNTTINLTVTPPLNSKNDDVFTIRVIAFSLSSPHVEDYVTLTTTAIAKEEAGEGGTESFFLPGMEGVSAVIAVGVIALLLRRKK
ncbi:MAG: CARDB domain-containing protein [Thermoplasmata archaeon]